MNDAKKKELGMHGKMALFALMAAGASFAMAGPGMMPRTGGMGGGGFGLPLLEVAVGVVLGGALYWWREVRGKEKK